MKKIIGFVSVCLVLVFVLCSCSTQKVDAPPSDSSAIKTISYRFADVEEGKALIKANQKFYDSFSQNDLSYRLQKSDATLDEYMVFLDEQVQSFTEEEIAVISRNMDFINARIVEMKFILPEINEIVFTRTTGKEHCNPYTYTMGNTIFITPLGLEVLYDDSIGGILNAQCELAYEIFYCLANGNKQFTEDMYNLIGFNISDQDFTLSSKVMEVYISNPNVDVHNASHTFVIQGQEIECYMVYCSKPYAEGDTSFKRYAAVLLVPVDPDNTSLYTLQSASNLDDIFGTNIPSIIDPGDYLAYSFAFSMIYGDRGPNGVPYSNDVIPAMYSYLTNNK